jgi:hypothetical protein
VKFGESWTNGRIAAGDAPIRFMTRTNWRARVREETFSMADETARTDGRSEVPRLRIGHLSARREEWGERTPCHVGVIMVLT